MQVTAPSNTLISGLLVFQPAVYSDHRGLFYELERANSWQQLGLEPMVQYNVSVSHKNVLRGLHYQQKPYEQAKLVSVLSGCIYDVAVDCRVASPTYKQWFGIELSSSKQTMLYIPRGFAHGFLAIADDTVVHYACDHYYHSKSEQTYRYDDPAFAIQWPLSQPPILSDKDRLVGDNIDLNP